MVSTITQSTPGYSDAHRKSPGLVNWAKQDNAQTKQDTRNKKKTRRKRRTTLGTPVSQSREEETTNKENYTGYPRSSQIPNKVQNWYCSASTGNAKLNKQERVNLKQTKLRKPSLPRVTQRRLTGTFVLFLRQYYLAPLHWCP